MALPMGARKRALSPPAAPANNIRRRSLAESLRIRAIHEPRPAPTCMMGPCLPALPLVAKVTMEANPLIRGTLARICPERL